ncbi:MAG: nucleotidyl transferase AbiEii/AbiGii toxin family protein [Gammaproteobacteria bacterium]
MTALPARTDALFRALREMSAIAPYTLVGGSALALRLQHRLSEDLDFAMEGPRLNRVAINTVIRNLDPKVFPVSKYPYDAQRSDFDNAGMDLDDAQQDYNVGGAKLSFFIPEYPRTLTEAVLDKPGEPVPGLQTGHIRVLDIESLAFMKSLLLASRITTRDLFDIVALVKHRSLTYTQLFDWQNSHALGYDWLRGRLREAKPAKNDPGVQSMDKSIPTDFSSLKDQLLAAMDTYEQVVASKALGSHLTNRPLR